MIGLVKELAGAPSTWERTIRFGIENVNATKGNNDGSNDAAAGRIKNRAEIQTEMDTSPLLSNKAFKTKTRLEVTVDK